MAGRRRRPAALILLFLAGLTASATAGFVGGSDQEVKAAVEPILDNLLAGYNDGDYARYSRDFDATLQEAIPERKFRETRAALLKKLGTFQNRQYLGYLNQNQYSVILWKGRFSGTADDVLIRLVASKRGARAVVTGLWFQ
jgi:hypothetical protein